jgi:hypothetical protein
MAKASLLAGIGLAVGVAFGGSIGFGVGFSKALPAAAVVPRASTAPGTGSSGMRTSSPAPTSTATDGPASPEIPPLTRSALTQTLDVNGRLRAGADALRTVLNARTFDASAAAQVLRDMSADSVFGMQLANRLGEWPRADSLSTGLERFYNTVHLTATEGLVASVRDEAAYRRTTRAMIKVLAGLAALDGEATLLAAEAGLAITPSVAP